MLDAAEVGPPWHLTSSGGRSPEARRSRPAGMRRDRARLHSASAGIRLFGKREHGVIRLRTILCEGTVMARRPQRSRAVRGPACAGHEKLIGQGSIGATSLPKPPLARGHHRLPRLRCEGDWHSSVSEMFLAAWTRVIRLGDFAISAKPMNFAVYYEMA